MTREMEIAWAAGLFEGEGCIHGSKGDRTQIHVTLGMTDQDAVERFARIMGVGKILFRAARSSRHKPIWRFEAHGVNAEAVVRTLLPFLCSRRSARAHELLAQRDVYRAHALRERDCQRCGEPFAPTHLYGMAVRQKFCSRRCRMQSADTAYRRRMGIPPHGQEPTCRHGHKYTPENTHITPQGHRSCRACSRRRTAESKQRRLAAA